MGTKRRKIMPKVEYSKAKGLVQKSGSGFSVKDVPVVEEIESVSTTGATEIKAHGTTLLTTGGAHSVTIPAGSYAGQRKLVVLVAAGGAASILGETDGADADNDEAVATLDTVGDFVLMLWIGDRWVELASEKA